MAEFFRSIVEPLQSSASVKSVFGEAVIAQGKTLIPVARIGYGFGGGEGRPGERHGGGGGGGVGAVPVGVFEVTADGTRFVPLHEKRNLIACGLIGLLAGWALGRRRRSART